MAIGEKDVDRYEMASFEVCDLDLVVVRNQARIVLRWPDQAMNCARCDAR
jgi:hypothetical protein